MKRKKLPRFRRTNGETSFIPEGTVNDIQLEKEINEIARQREVVCTEYPASYMPRDNTQGSMLLLKQRFEFLALFMVRLRRDSAII